MSNTAPAGVPQPHEVFTPTRAPLKATNVYVRRLDAEIELQAAVTQAYTPVIFGEFGVGKTSLALMNFRTEADQNRLVHYTNPEGKRLDDVYKQALEQLGYVVEVALEASNSVSVGAEVEGGIWGTLKAKLSGATESTETVTTEILVKSPTDAGILSVLEQARLVILIDELHRADESFKAGVARLIKSLSDRGRDYPVLVIAGTSSQPEQLVQSDQGVDRLLREVPVRPLTDNESHELIRTGFHRLNLTVDEDLRNRIVSTVAGAPSLLHAVCLEAALNARARESIRLFDLDVDHAVRRVVQRTYYRLTERYMKATNTMGQKRYREQILRAAAEFEGDFITMEVLVSKVSQYVGETTPRTRLSDPLRELKSDKFGNILADVQRADGEGRTHNLTVFTDPQMKAYVRFISKVKEQGLLEDGSGGQPAIPSL